MIDFPNFKNINSAGRANAGRRIAAPKAEADIKAEHDFSAAGKTNAPDVIQISTDAALKGKLSAFAAALAKEMDTDNTGRIAYLKKQYAGDCCPVSDIELAGAIAARIKMEGFW